MFGHSKPKTLLLGLGPAFDPHSRNAKKTRVTSILSSKRHASFTLERSSRSNGHFVKRGTVGLPIEELQESLAFLKVSTPKAGNFDINDENGNFGGNADGWQGRNKGTWSWKKAARRRRNLALTSRRED